MIGKLIRLLVVLAVLGFAIVVVYAYLGDMTPEQKTHETEIRLGGD